MGGVFLSSIYLLYLLHLIDLNSPSRTTHGDLISPFMLAALSMDHVYCIVAAVQMELRFSVRTFLGENTPRVPPSSLMATPISASRASLRTAQSQSETSTHRSEGHTQRTDNH